MANKLTNNDVNDTKNCIKDFHLAIYIYIHTHIDMCVCVIIYIPNKAVIIKFLCLLLSKCCHTQ